MGSSPGMATTSNAENMATIVRDPKGIYSLAMNQATPGQFATRMTSEFANMRDPLKSTFSKGTGFANDLEYLQALVRNGKGTSWFSKGTTPLGIISNEDMSAIQNLFKESFNNGMTWDVIAKAGLTSTFRTGAASTFSKSVSTAMHLLDANEAADTISKAYYTSFGFYPSQDLITKFKDDFNARAKKEATVTTTQGTAGKSTSISVGGFTSEEQDQFIANFLKKNYNVTGKEETGYAKDLVDKIKGVYENNLLPVDDMDSILKFVGSVVGTADQTIRTQMIDSKLKSIRTTAAKLNPGLQDMLDGGEDVSAYLKPVVNQVNSVLGTNLSMTDDRFKSVLNVSDGKTTRTMNSLELKNFVEAQPEYQRSSSAIDKYVGWGNAIKDYLK